jgi:predicted O-methyltransferase YrrM
MFSQRLWNRVDRYIEDVLVQPGAALAQTLHVSDAAGLPAISVTAAQGKLLQILARMLGARRILEIGTLGGYSTIWLARALPADGQLVTLEHEPKHAQVAQENLAHAGLAQLVDIRVGRALDSLQKLAAESVAPFDFIFIDADKASSADYFDWSVRLARAGSVIVVDNVVRAGGVIEARSRDTSIVGIRRMNQLIANDRRVSATAIQTVGAKGYDGFAIALVE